VTIVSKSERKRKETGVIARQYVQCLSIERSECEILAPSEKKRKKEGKRKEKKTYGHKASSIDKSEWIGNGPF